jgi:hypothetical protein
MAEYAAAAVMAYGAYESSRTSKRSAKQSIKAMKKASAAGIAEERSQFEQIQDILSPYVEAGTGALKQQQALAGILGPEAQQKAISGIEESPTFGALVRQGEEGILQSAAATGGLRGGNVQGALAQFRPALLSQLIESQYSKLGGIAQLGQASAAGVGSAGLQTGSNIANLLTQQGQAQAGGILGQGQAQANLIGGYTQAAGTLLGSYLNRPIPETPPPSETGTQPSNVGGYSIAGGQGLTVEEF